MKITEHVVDVFLDFVPIDVQEQGKGEGFVDFILDSPSYLDPQENCSKLKNVRNRKLNKCPLTNFFKDIQVLPFIKGSKARK